MYRTSAVGAGRWLARLTAIVMALALTLGIAGAIAPANASPAAPAWLVRFVKSQARGQAVGIMETLGYHCANTPFVCWRDTDYDPPR